MDFERRLQELGGAARWGQIGASRNDRRHLAELVASGRVVAHPGGCLALPGTDADVVHARQFSARLTCVTAARAHDLSLLTPPAESHLAVAHARGVVRTADLRGTRIVIHREGPAMLTAVPHPASTDQGGPLVVTPAEALARMLRCQEDMAAAVAVDSALNRRLCTVRDIDVLLRGPGSARARAVLAECDGRSLSPAETVARVTLRRAGLSVVPNVYITGVGWVDLLVEERVVVELDGYAYHSSIVAFRTDRRRDRELQSRGLVALRFPADEAVRNPDELLTCVRRNLARG
jgi:very-short-patch-repair endonuclease/fructose-specific component phosphotransferase system IIB-like protein